MTDPTTILREAIKAVVIESDADDVLATRIPQACQTCKGSGSIIICDECGARNDVLDWCANCSHRCSEHACPDCPTLATLLLWGWNVAKAEAEDRGDGDAPYVTVHYPVSTKFAVNLLTELREVPT